MDKYIELLNQIVKINNKPTPGSYKCLILFLLALLFGLFFCFERILFSDKFKSKFKKVGTLCLILILAIPLVFSLFKIQPPTKYPKSTATSIAVKKAHQKYPYVLQYDQLENGFWGTIFGETDQTKVLVKSNKTVPQRAVKIVKTNNDSYCLRTFFLPNNKRNVQIADSRHYLQHKIYCVKRDS